MQRVKLTYEGAFHHGMNCGINGGAIFEGAPNKSFSLDFLEMNNHYHLVLQNTSGKLYQDLKARLQKDDQKK